MPGHNHYSDCTCGWCCGGSRSVGDIEVNSWQHRDEDFRKPAICSKCNNPVFFIRHNGGRVCFDKLGYPWPIHPCYEYDRNTVLLHRLLMDHQKYATESVLGVVLGTETRRTAMNNRIIIRCSDGTMIDQAVTSQCDFKQLPGSLVLIARDTKGGLSLRFVSNDFCVKSRVEKRVFLRFESSDSNILDTTVQRITAELQVAGGVVQGPYPLPTRRECYTVISSNLRRRFSIETHKRLAILVNAQPSAFAQMGSSEMPAGVSISLRVINYTIMQVDQR